MRKETKSNLSKIINYLLNNNSINIDNNPKLYRIVMNDYNNLSRFFTDNFNIDIYKRESGSEVYLNKISYNNPLGFGKTASLLYFRYLFLTLSELAAYQEGGTPFWPDIESQVKLLYKNFFDHDLTVKENLRASQAVRELLIEKGYLKLKDQTGADGDVDAVFLYTLLKHPNKKDIKKRTLKISDNFEIQIKNKLLLTSSLNKSKDGFLFEKMRNNEKGVLDKINNFFENLVDEDGVGYVLLDWNDAFVLAYRGVGDFPKVSRKEDRLFIESVNFLDPYKHYDYSDFEDISKDTIVYRETKTLRDSLSVSVRFVIEKMLYYNLIIIDGDGYKTTNCVNHIKKEYNKETQLELRME